MEMTVKHSMTRHMICLVSGSGKSVSDSVALFQQSRPGYWNTLTVIQLCGRNKGAAPSSKQIYSNRTIHCASIPKENASYKQKDSDTETQNSVDCNLEMCKQRDSDSDTRNSADYILEEYASCKQQSVDSLAKSNPVAGFSNQLQTPQDLIESIENTIKANHVSSSMSERMESATTKKSHIQVR
jgi:hypothetical protein